MTSEASDFPVLLFEQPEELSEWIDAHPDAQGVWLKFAKKGTSVKSINYHQSLEVALCHGWIDSTPQKFDDVYYLQKFTPRRKRSAWSVRNKKIVGELIEAGRMRPAGQREIDLAKADGRWDAAYESASKAELPKDFLKEIEKHPAAKAFLATINASNRYAIYYRLHTAKRPETREKRLKQIIEMLNNDQVFHP